MVMFLDGPESCPLLEAWRRVTSRVWHSEVMSLPNSFLLTLSLHTAVIIVWRRKVTTPLTSVPRLGNPYPSLTVVPGPSFSQAAQIFLHHGETQAALVSGSPSPSLGPRVVGSVPHPSTSWGIFCSLKCVQRPHSPCTWPVGAKRQVAISQHKQRQVCSVEVRMDFQELVKLCFRLKMQTCAPGIYRITRIAEVHWKAYVVRIPRRKNWMFQRWWYWARIQESNNTWLNRRLIWMEDISSHHMKRLIYLRAGPRPGLHGF